MNGICSIGQPSGARAWGAIAVAGALVCAVNCAGPAETNRPALLPDVGAPPRLVAVSVNSARRAALRNADLVTNLVNGLPRSTGFLVLTNDRPAFTVVRHDQPDRVRFLDVPSVNATTIWTQDPFLVLSTPEGDVTLLMSRDFERADDRVMAEVISRATGYRVQRSGLFFEGGNIVSDADHVLIGADTIRRNALELDVAEQEVVLRFEEQLGRPVVVVGPVPQPIPHIDMMLTPLGSRTVLVADAGAGARIAERALQDEPEAVAAFERRTEEQFFGDPSVRQVNGIRGPLIAPRLQGRARDMIARSRDIAPVLDEVARSLEAYGYRVARIPLLFGGPDVDQSEPGDNRPLQAGYPMLTYNNVLLAEDGGGKRVYLPRYGWAAMDAAATHVWEALGFATRTIDGFTISAMYGGALRCSVKVLAR